MSDARRMLTSEVFWVAVGVLLQGVAAIIAYSALR
jgi:hypothetical protein